MIVCDKQNFYCDWGLCHGDYDKGALYGYWNIGGVNLYVNLAVAIMDSHS